MGDFNRWVQGRDWHCCCWDRAFSNLSPCQYHLREQDVSLEISPESGKIPWTMQSFHGNAPLARSPGGLCTGTGKAQLKHTLDKENDLVRLLNPPCTCLQEVENRSCSPEL